MPSSPSTQTETIEWRAVGYDAPTPGTDPVGTFEWLGWTSSREEAESDAKALKDSEPQYDDVWLERRVVTVSEPERIAP